MDMKKGYWMVVLHPDSRSLMCMALDIGRFQWTRLPIGTVVASDIFQRKLDEVYANLPGVTGIADDMVINGTSTEEHDRNFFRFLKVPRKHNLHLNKDKLQFHKETVDFFGHWWNINGISPDPKKIKAITSMEFPPDKETMQSFLGLVNFLNRYSGNLVETFQTSSWPVCPPCILQSFQQAYGSFPSNQKCILIKDHSSLLWLHFTHNSSNR